MIAITGFGLSPIHIETNLDNTSNLVFGSKSLIFQSTFAEEEESSSKLKGIFNLDELNENQILFTFGISAILIIVTVFMFRFLGKKTFKGIILNEHGYPTLSKFQFWLWTLIISFTFLALQIMKIIATDYAAGQEYLIQDIPENLLAMMGISVAVPIAASGITNKMKNINKVDTAASFGSMFRNYEGNLDLSRLQMFLWTIIGIVIYLQVFIDQIFTLESVNQLFLPDVSPTLVILMGLSQTAYLGSKLASRSTEENNSTNTVNDSNKKNT